MDEKLRIQFRERLDQEAAELTRSEAATEDERAPVELDQSSVGRLARMDALQVQAMASAQSRRRTARLAAIRAALARLHADEFGYCESCGEPIARGRMELDPCVTRCIACAR
ncbi:MAG: TraR/DksA C4-type zinc finger protein [Pseudomonadota bacterium]